MGLRTKFNAQNQINKMPEQYICQRGPAGGGGRRSTQVSTLAAAPPAGHANNIFSA